MENERRYVVIQVRPDARRRLKVMAAKERCTMGQMLDRLLNQHACSCNKSLHDNENKS
jgi:hypothetical protein